MPIRITGMNSGLDTEALVSELVSAYRKKTEKYTKAQTKLSWKQDAWKDLNKKVSTFYSSVTSLRFSSAYNSKKATVSDTSAATVTAKSTAVTGAYSLKINKVAKAGYLTGAELKEGTTAGSTLSSLGYTGESGTINVTVGGETKGINVSSSTTISDFVTALNDAGVKANYDATYNRIFVSAEKAGKENDFVLTGGNKNGNLALQSLGLYVASDVESSLHQDYANYARNEDGEAYITYDDKGKVVTNGVYSAEKTKAYIEETKTGLGDASTRITQNTARVEYANAYKKVQNAEANFGADTAGLALFKTLAGEQSLGNVYVDADGNIYDKKTEGDTTTYVKRATDTTFQQEYTEEELQNAGITLTAGQEKYTELIKTAKMTGTDYLSALDKVNTADLSYVDPNGEIAAAYSAGEDTFGSYVQNLGDEIVADREFVKENQRLDIYAGSLDTFLESVTNAAGMLDGSAKLENSKGAVRIAGENTEIELNGAVFTSDSNEMTINGLTINAMATTTKEISITVTNDAQGMYDKIKGFIKEYNTLINEMTKLYGAESSKGYEPLTSEEKDAMTDTEIEEWEKKIKNSLLRRDTTLDTLLSSMKNVMFKSYEVNGKNYSLSSWGICTLGVLTAADNEENAFHIDGDSEDSTVSGKTDKLMAALQEDPDTVANFMTQLAKGLYDAIGSKMSSTTLSSYGVVYNDKEMAREYSDYTTTISKWEDKLTDIEDSYYKKFAAMESALATLQSQQSSLAGMLGM